MGRPAREPERVRRFRLAGPCRVQLRDMHRRQSTRCALALFAALATSATAGAQELAVRTIEHGTWAAAVAAMRSSPRAQGTRVHVVVDDPRGGRAPCGRYALRLDAAGSRAFAIGTCDPRTAATPLRLIDRRALFYELGDGTARPRAIRITAMEVRHASDVGRARTTARTEVGCSLVLRPYLVDELAGVRVRATPDRFELRQLGGGAQIEADTDSWSVRSASVLFEYELVDKRTGDVVLREAVVMSCAREAPGEPRARERRFPFERTLSGNVSRHAGRCGGERAPEHVYTLHVETPTWVSLRVEARFDAAIYVRDARGGELDCSIVPGRTGEVRVPRAWAELAPGTYYVIVDGAGPPPDDGRYRLALDYLRVR